MADIHPSSTSPSASAAQTPSFDIFLSHAGEDKETIARPLYQRLHNHGISVFFDVESFRLGDDCPKVMVHAMQTTPIGIFIMSPEFVAKEWPMRELLCFVERHDRAAAANEAPPLLIPVFYRLCTRDCRDPNLFDTYSSIFRQYGLIKRAMSGKVSVQAVSHALDTAATVWSIENDLGASNCDRPNMFSTREFFIQMIEYRVLERLREERPELMDRCHPVADVKSQHQDGYNAVNMVPPNPLRLTLDYTSPTTCEGRLRAAVLRESGSRMIAVIASGKGGVGKTCALKGLAEEVQVKEAFPDGILYIELGNNAGTSDLVEGVAKIVDLTGGSELKSEIKGAKFVKEACEKAAKWFGSRKCLFLIDDIWKLNGIDSKVLATLGLIVNRSSRMIYTTRDEHFLRRANEVIRFEEKETFGDLSRQMLLKHAGFEEGIVLDHKNEEALKYFLGLCGGLPLGFGIVGGCVWEYSHQCLNKQDALSEFYGDILSNQKNLMDEEADEYGKLPRIVDMSLQVLKKRNMLVDFEQTFRALCVLQKQQSVPAQMLQKLWDLDTLKETRAVVESLAHVSVVQMRRKEGSMFVKLHDLILDIAAWKADEENETQSFFQRLVGNYVSCDRERMGDERGVEEVVRGAIEPGAASSLLCHAWWKVEDDGYIYNNVCMILRRAGYVDELLRLLSQPQWIVKRLVEGSILCVEQDLAQGKAMNDDNTSRYADRKEHLEMIGRAARLSAWFVNRNPREVWFQLHGRLLWHATQSERTRDFVKRMEMRAPKPWLKASLGLLQQAGSGLLDVFNGPGQVLCTRLEGDKIWVLWEGTNNVMRVGSYNLTYNRYESEELELLEEGMGVVKIASFLPDQRRVVTAHNKSMRVWNRQTGTCEQMILHRCQNHRSYIQFYADGNRMACETEDHSVRLWDTLSGKPVGQPLQGHTRLVNCIAISADRTWIVSGSSDGTVRVWDARSGNVVGHPLRGHSDWVMCVAVSADCTRIVSGSLDRTVRMWDARSNHAVGAPLQGHTGVVNCVTISADGSKIVSGSSDATLRVWDAQGGNAVGQPLKGHALSVTSVAISADGTRIASWSRDETVRVWDAQNTCSSAVGQMARDRTNLVNCVAASANGSRIVSGSQDAVMRVWDATNGDALGQPLQVPALSVWEKRRYERDRKLLKGPAHVIRHVAMSADGTRVVSDDGVVLRLWAVNAHGGECVLTSRDVAWQPIDMLAFTWSRGSWRPASAKVSDGEKEGAQIVLGTCEAPVGNVNDGDVYFDVYFKSCRIVR